MTTPSTSLSDSESSPAAKPAAGKPARRRVDGQFRPGGGEGGAAGRITKVIQNGSMPPAKYTLIHSDAKLSDAERQQLIQGLQATLAQPAQ
jgi:Haem-binding domain